jgi:hypothetical protein
MPLAEDQHPVGDLSPGGEHEPFCISVRARASPPAACPSRPQDLLTCVTRTSRNAISCRLSKSEMNRKITAGWSINWQTR